MNKKMLFVYNAHAGKAKIKNKLADILEIFTRGGYEVTTKPTLKQGDATLYVQNRSHSYDLVVCSGGDGTLDEVVNGMLRSEFMTPIGYIPAGSTNDFGATLGISNDMEKAAETIMEGKDFFCDVGLFNEMIFTYVAAFGIFTEVSYETAQEWKNRIGHAAYLLEGMKHVLDIKTNSLRVSYEDQVIEGDFIFGMITNSSSVGGVKGITGKDVQLDDGLFEVTLIKMPQNPLELNDILVALVSKSMDSEYIYQFMTSELTIESDNPIAWTLDGENGGQHKEVTIKNIAKGIDIKVNS